MLELSSFSIPIAGSISEATGLRWFFESRALVSTFAHVQAFSLAVGVTGLRGWFSVWNRNRNRNRNSEQEVMGRDSGVDRRRRLGKNGLWIQLHGTGLGRSRCHFFHPSLSPPLTFSSAGRPEGVAAPTSSRPRLPVRRSLVPDTGLTTGLGCGAWIVAATDMGA